jgi:hypothetical protein
LVIDHFNKEASHILSELHSHPRSLFLYLKTVIEVHLSGTLKFSYLRQDDFMDSSDVRRLKDQSRGLELYMEKISDFPKFLRNNPVEVTDDMIELYLEVSICKLYLNFKYEMIEVVFGICICIWIYGLHLQCRDSKAFGNPLYT